MQASQEIARVRCGECDTENLAGARFCKGCGASVAPPPKCPKCEMNVEADAKFCAQCGTKLVGARPEPSPTKANGKPAATAKTDELQKEKGKLPPPAKPSSNMMGNVALFVAFLIATIAVIVYMNKDAPKEMSPFQGGPPPASVSATPPPATAGEGAGEVASGGPISGEITLGSSVGQGSGTLFIVLRAAGTPNQGPPVAVKKIESPSFPASFEVSQADVMMKGMPFLGPFDIYVRLDQDGNAMTKDAGDLVNSAPASSIAPGSTGVKIELDKRL